MSSSTTGNEIVVLTANSPPPLRWIAFQRPPRSDPFTGSGFFSLAAALSPTFFPKRNPHPFSKDFRKRAESGMCGAKHGDPSQGGKTLILTTTGEINHRR
jgi:hypothetical protein